MWERAELKARAKQVLKENYWKSFLISLVLLLSGADSRGGGSSGRGAGERIGEWIDYSEYLIIIIAVVILVIAFRVLIDVYKRQKSLLHWLYSLYHIYQIIKR